MSAAVTGAAALPRDVVAGLTALLCDADGNLFPSEEPAFVASAEVTNRLLAELGDDRRLTPEELRLATTGMNFRTTSRRLAAEAGRPEVDVEPWVAEEKAAVTAHLGEVLRPHGPTSAALAALAPHLRLAAVSSSALARLAACFTATGLDELIPPAARFSAEDSLPTPTSKPDPAVYLHACETLGIAPAEGLAVEDSVPGALSAVRAGCPTVGNLLFVQEAERADRAAALREAGVLTVVSSWQELADLLLPVLTGGGR
ncbi:haloacid dehalogenase superfamily, subfamily IA, variant 3 with third motif having DD or ED [Geodermatophilus dictyosporus]|uniref:Haloacid dehalogenase superfamily, subfamily IA, variant 3 with third motif having DD or ED n=1 Tax=Geodermatophilus dictyosporus TaxID=1523247 RepID=A0A1I5TWN4_9ACTN|nr:HAD family phosphatase [Geodermatophilus dictyosporus]SFP87418.1 haloacid dehalogenase superfamily, subfamily IA, variant 3 with third motif having DD or ED [Geodermatophilus dictyosporus]